MGVLAVGWSQAAPRADPQVLVGGVAHLGYGLPAVVPATHEVTYKTITPTVDTNVVATGAAVPVAVGGYKAVAGSNGDLAGPVHEVPALFGAPATYSQVNEDSQGSLTVGTSAFLTSKITGYDTKVLAAPVHYIGKREAGPAVVLPYAAGLAYPYAAPVATYAVPKVETEVTATNLPVPVAVGGYKAVAGDNGDLPGAVHEVPALFAAPALNKQVNEASQGSLTVGTSALLTSKVTGYNTVAAPFHYIGKREAEADPALLYSTYGYGLPTYSAYAGYAGYAGYSPYYGYG